MRAVNVNKSDLYPSAVAYFRAGELDKALRAAEEVLRVDSGAIKARRLLADIHVAKGNFPRALHFLEQALALLPGDSTGYFRVAVHRAGVLLRAGDLAGAAAALDNCDLSRTQDIDLLTQAGYIYTLCARYDHARKNYERALSLAPENPQIIFNCAAANRAMGDLERAERLYDRAIALVPEDWEAYKNRSDLRRQTEKNNHIAQLRQLLARPGLPQRARVQLNFALAKELEDLALYPESFAALERGCAARRAGIRYNLQRDLAVMAEIASTYGAALMDGQSCDNTQGEGILFILGMPRTGTTLVDRILTAVPGVVSAGEPDTFARLLGHQVAQQFPGIGADKLAFVRNSAAIDFGALGKHYADQLRQRARQLGGGIIIDKNPMNFLYVGLIRKALPAAKIIHVRRDPMDSCYAIYKTLFKTAYPFSYDQRELGAYYLAYQSLMDHWTKLVSENFYALEYEKLVGDLEGEARALLQFCGLPWDSRCLEFHRASASGTATASAAQVRQPVYRSSIGKWKHYREQLRPLAEILREGGIPVDVS
ncbi:hypothetical protein A3224_14325 [Microbulbifer thermotolerans]|uniref:Uncharacterized protein n=1 Tax=Microbulbifer thermotolerans TaxID=252514 RepID=A0A143HPF8_MICTH|nr:hypothetical protein A3224_14325 [Microbulbifer thermotolerans]